MRAISFAVAGNHRLGARVFAALHDMGHDVMPLCDASGPLADMAAQLGAGLPDAQAAPAQVEWRIDCGGADPRFASKPRHVLSFSARAPAFPPASVSLTWQWHGPAGVVDVASRTCDFGRPVCGADIVAQIETEAEALLVDIVSQLGRDILTPETLAARAPATPVPGSVLLDLHALLGWHASNETKRASLLESMEPSLPEMVSRTALATPSAIALRDAQGDVDYRTFVGASMKLAAQLAALLPTPAAIDDGAPSVIAVRLPKSRLLYTAILGAIGAGAAYAPLDPSFPPERVRQILEQSRATCLITDDDFDASAIDGLAIDVIRLRELDGSDVDIGVTAWPVARHADRASRCAITIFTSGSTGTPKGVMLTHRNIVHFCHWYRDYIGMDASSRVLQFCTVAFDVSLLDIFPTFLSGATLVIPTEAQRHALDDLSELIEREALTHAFLPPALLGVMPDADWPALRHLLTGGDVCFPDTIARWSRGREFHNIFGPAECTVLVTIARLEAGDSNRLIGQPIANVRCYVLDEAGQPARTGEPGELCVAGAGVADGYLHRPDLTERSFVPNPFADPDGAWPSARDEMLYRTGDIVQWDEDGLLHFVGRRDAQVKIRGFRVELGEIEGAALATGLFGQCACVVDERKRIRGFVARPLEIGANGDTLRDLLVARLPDYMVPYEIVVLDALPATNNGKIDRAALARIPAQRTGAADAGAQNEPLTEMQTRLRALWARLLDLEPFEIGRDDSFFNLGGHSLLVSKLMLAVKKEFGGNAPLARFMERPTIAALASLLSNDDVDKGERIPPRVFDDMVLPDEIRPVDGLRPVPDGARAVLLTGANGFLGTFIAAELIAQTTAVVHCMVRAASQKEGEARLAQALQANGLGALAGHPRLKVVLGDLAEPRLGLTPSTWRTLAHDIDAIYHNGAHVNHVYDYPYLYDANVGATLELLRLACEFRNKSMHFVSTLSAASAMDETGHILEQGPARNAPAFVNNGYNVTKWVAEHLVWEAAERGIDATILRPGNITGVAETGLCQPTRNRILLLVKGSLQLGAAPAGDTDFDFMPVDFLARAIVRCTTDPQRELRVFHLQNPQPLTWEDYLGAVVECGYPLTLEEPAKWQQRLTSIDESNALYDVVAFYLDDSQEDIGDMSRIAHERTAGVLARLGVAYPRKDGRLLASHFRYLIQSGFLPAPTSSVAQRTERETDTAPVA
ncbi:amino acid adenylation domain-containing protein [Pandoraea pulmonicola]|uniref:Linear gramicidin synthase subunit D n=1 Tax=Pandoraea pulmonicola TaxID=93221 RepID=A0AAJ4ZA51_PANPU|nr:amino acid adenylation domain-containing protein [Pandoraea pulmonicola]AJC21592.1 peptide synthetase [Pandoraea pulmonicola]SUA89589.1 Linear gramicidin synthase subunit D [Pandoraea pulmonicola]